MKKIPLLILLFVVLSMTSCELFNPTQPKVKIYGLFVGIDYKNNLIPDPIPPQLDIDNDLDGTINDTTNMVTAFYTLAQSYGVAFEGFLALQEGTETEYDDLLYPSRENIIARIEDIGNMMNENDIFLFYYSGHGMGNPNMPYIRILAT